MAAVKVKSEVAGKVWQVVIRPSEPVAKDDIILILESMKMEIAVQAPVSGTLRELLVEENGEVSEGQDLAIIDS